MSIKVMSHVWEHSTHKGSELITLLAISDYADDAGVAYPSITSLAHKARLKDRNVQYVIAKLERSKELSITRNAGPNGCHIYKVSLVGVQSLRGAKFAPQEEEETPLGNTEEDVSMAQGAKFAPGAKFAGGVQSLRGATAIAPEPSEDLKRKDLPPCLPTEDIPPQDALPAKRPGKPKATAYTPGFLAFWDAYPHERYARKPTCYQVWVRQNLEPRTDEIVEKIERLKVTQWAGQSPHYIPLTSTWMNSGDFDTELIPLPREGPPGGRLSPKTARNVEASRRIIEEIERGPNGQSPIFLGAHLHG